MTKRTRRKYDKAWEMVNIARDRNADLAVALALSAKIYKVSLKYLVRLYAERRRENLQGGAQRPLWV